ncbi:MAG TPA: ClpXP protease specificity-enhancing factor [Wenzhouxiangella sp.]
MATDHMPSSKPYLLRAINEWIVDSNLTPHLLASGDADDLEVPPQAIQEGKVVLNISPSAVRDLVLDNEAVSFVARFGGVSQAVWVPMAAIEGIYARENGRGMVFADEVVESTDAADGSDGAVQKNKQSKGPSLRVVK